MQKVIFNSSMPRSCSTLLQNILGQNPNIHSTPTDGFLELLYAARGNYTDSPEFKAQDQELVKNAWKNFCKSGLYGYCSGLTDKPIVALKGRGYGIHYNWFEWFMGEQPKVICMIRNLKGIIASMEKIHRKNIDKHSSLVDHSRMLNTTTIKRVDTFLNSPPVGLALERIFQMIQEGIDKKVLFVRAEDLATKPDETLKKIYEYTQIPFFNHDFQKIEQITKEDDEVYGMGNLHTIKNKLEPIPEDWNNILGAELANSIDFKVQWYQRYFGYVN